MSDQKKAAKSNLGFYRNIGWFVLMAFGVFGWMIYDHQVQLNRSIEKSIEELQEEQLRAEQETDALADEIIALMKTGVPVDPHATPLLLHPPLKKRAISVLLQQIGDPRFAVAFPALQNLKTLLAKIGDSERFADQVIPGVLPMLKHPERQNDVIDILEAVRADLSDVQPQLLATIRPSNSYSVDRAIDWARKLNLSCDVIPFYVQYMKQKERPNKDFVWLTSAAYNVEPAQLVMAMERELQKADTPAEKAAIQAWIESIQSVADQPLFRPLAVPSSAD